MSAVKIKTTSNPNSIAAKVIENLGLEILKLIEKHVAEEIEYATNEGFDGYTSWHDSLSDSDMSYELNKLIDEYLTKHLAVETKFTFME